MREAIVGPADKNLERFENLSLDSSVEPLDKLKTAEADFDQYLQPTYTSEDWSPFLTERSKTLLRAAESWVGRSTRGLNGWESNNECTSALSEIFRSAGLGGLGSWAPSVGNLIRGRGGREVNWRDALPGDVVVIHDAYGPIHTGVLGGNWQLIAADTYRNVVREDLYSLYNVHEVFPEYRGLSFFRV